VTGKAAGQQSSKCCVFNAWGYGVGRAQTIGMILLITPSARAQECARALEEATSEPAQVAASLRQAATQLREQEFLAVVVDQSLVEAEPEESDLVLQHIGTAIPVYVNFAISGIERVVRELRAALHRRKREVAVARQAAEQALRNELKDTLTALLLSSEMALRGAELSADAAGRLQTVQELAQSLRGKLGMVD